MFMNGYSQKYEHAFILGVNISPVGYAAGRVAGRAGGRMGRVGFLPPASVTPRG
jgi:hypothetical protein